MTIEVRDSTIMEETHSLGSARMAAERRRRDAMNDEVVETLVPEEEHGPVVDKLRIKGFTFEVRIRENSHGIRIKDVIVDAPHTQVYKEAKLVGLPLLGQGDQLQTRFSEVVTTSQDSVGNRVTPILKRQGNRKETSITAL